MIIDTLRKPKILDFVIFDWVATILSAHVVSSFTDYNFIIVLIILLIISVILHVVFKIDTKTNYLLGISEYPIREADKMI
ncbi:MAG: hypothetical protein ACRCZI_03900 [Cetobacterium sp.]